MTRGGVKFRNSRRVPFIVLAATATCVSCGEEGGSSERDGFAASRDGTTIAYFVEGDSEASRTLVVINGGPGYDHRDGLFASALVTEDLRVVLFDQRGTGQSDTDGNAEMSPVSHAEDVEAIRTELGVEHVDVLGVSWGGLVAQYYATRFPKRVSSLVLAASMAGSWRIDGRFNACWQQRIRTLQARGYIPTVLPTSDPCAFDSAILPAFFHDPAFIPPDYFVEAECRAPVVRATLDAIGRFELSEQLGQLQLPVLLVAGRSDCTMTYFDDHALMFNPDYIQTYIVEEAGHAVFAEKPDETLGVVEDFLVSAVEPTTRDH